MYDWPIPEIQAALDGPVQKVAAKNVRDAVTKAGYGARLADFLADFYPVANGGTFYQGALRVLPLEGIPEQRPSLVEWNELEEWKQFAPPGCRKTFYFLSNAFGDLLGVPLNDQRDLAKDTTSIVWVESFKQEESALGWDEIFRKFLKNEDHMATFLARLKEYDWAVGGLGRPDPDQCFSWKLLPAMGGSEGLDNLQIVSTYVHVSFTFQVFRQHLDANPPTP
ncbi:MAG: T6SS immunity protein Tdi1 domain-containing protein [Planctomycetota bacterium]